MHILDKPIPAGVYFYRQLLNDFEVRAVFVTARTHKVRDYTLKQLTELFGMRDYELHMNPYTYRYMEDADLKLHLIKEAGIDYSDIFIAFDDRPSVCEAYRAVGITAYQTDKGY